MSTPVLRVDRLGKEYKLYASPRARLRSLLFSGAPHKSHWVLKDLSFTLHRGQCLGVVGNNGAGKSSLLKLIVGTLQASTGRIERIGRITAILELGAGFHPDFSGRDNLFFGGQLIGISEAQMHQLMDSIIDFSELGEAIDRPVKSYSSGMAVRLAFALVTAIEPDVLVIDEALAVGDQHFQKKCMNRIEAFRRNGCTILFCSHSMYHIRHLCDVALWLDAGQAKAYGETETVLAAYEVHVRQQDAPALASVAGVTLPIEKAVKAQTTTPTTHLGGKAEIVSVLVAHLNAEEIPLLTVPDLAVTVVVRGSGDERPNIGVMLEQAQGTGITSVTTHTDGVAMKPVAPNGAQASGHWQATVTFPDLPLHSGEYVLSFYLFDSHGFVVYDEWLRSTLFKVIYPSLVPGLVRLPHHWS